MERSIDGVPINAKENGGGIDVEEDHGFAKMDVVVDSPAHSSSQLVQEVDGHADLAADLCGGQRGGR